MKKNLFILILIFLCFNLFAYEKFTNMFGVTKGMSMDEVKKHAESENWLFQSEKDGCLYYMPSIQRMGFEGFYGAMVPQFVVSFKNDGVSSFIFATNIEDTDTLAGVLNQLDEKYGLEYAGTYKDHYLCYKMSEGDLLLLSWETSRNLLTGEISEYIQFTINMF